MFFKKAKKISISNSINNTINKYFVNPFNNCNRFLYCNGKYFKENNKLISKNLNNFNHTTNIFSLKSKKISVDNNLFLNFSKKYFTDSIKFEKTEKEIFQEKLEKLKLFKFEKSSKENLIEIYSDSDLVLKHLDENDPDFKKILDINFYVIAVVKDKKSNLDLRKKLKENKFNLDENLNLFKALYFNLISIWRILTDLETHHNKKLNENNLKSIINKHKISNKNNIIQDSDNMELNKKNEANKLDFLNREKTDKILPSENPTNELNQKIINQENNISEDIINNESENLSKSVNNNIEGLEKHLNENIELLNNHAEIQLKNMGTHNYDNRFNTEKEDINNDSKLPVYMEAIRDDILCNYVYEDESDIQLKNKNNIEKKFNKSLTDYGNKNNNTSGISNEGKSNNLNQIINQMNDISLSNINTEKILNSLEDNEIKKIYENLNNFAQEFYFVKNNANANNKKFKLSQFINNAYSLSEILYSNLDNINTNIKSYPYVLFEVYKVYYLYCILNLQDEEKANEVFEKVINIFKKFNIEAHYEYSFNINVMNTEFKKLNKPNNINYFTSIIEQKLKIDSETSSEDFEKIIELSAFIGNFYLQNLYYEKAINVLQNILNNLNLIANNEIENNKIENNLKYNSFIKIYRLLANLYGNTSELEKSKVLCMKALEINNKINDLYFILNLFDFNYTLSSLATKPYLYIQDFMVHFNNIKNLYLQIFEDEPEYVNENGNYYKNKKKDLINNNKGMEIFGKKETISLLSEEEINQDKLPELSNNHIDINDNNENHFISNNLNNKNIDFNMQKNLLNNTNKFSEINQKIKSLKLLYKKDPKFMEIKSNILLGYMHLIYILLTDKESQNVVDPEFENETEETTKKLNEIILLDVSLLNEITETKYFNEKISLNYVIDWKTILAEYCFRYGLNDNAILHYIDLLTMNYHDSKVKYMIYIENVTDPIDFILKRLIELSVHIKTKEIRDLYENTLKYYEIVKK